MCYIDPVNIIPYLLFLFTFQSILALLEVIVVTKMTDSSVLDKDSKVVGIVVATVTISIHTNKKSCKEDKLTGEKLQY